MDTEQETNQINVYTDGSKTKDGVGSGWLITRDDYILDQDCLKLDDHATVFQAETYAITSACKAILANPIKYMHKNVQIFSDSQSLVYAHRNPNIRTKSVAEMVKHMIEVEIAISGKINLNWIKGHDNNTGNEYADYLAKKGCKSANKISTPISVNDVNGIIRKHTFSKWNLIWKTLAGHNESKAFISNMTDKHQKALMSLNRCDLKKVLQFSTGHTTLRGHLQRMGKASSPTCRGCGELEEKPSHIMQECPRYWQERHSTSSIRCPVQRTLAFIELPKIANLLRVEIIE